MTMTIEDKNVCPKTALLMSNVYGILNSSPTNIIPTTTIITIVLTVSICISHTHTQLPLDANGASISLLDNKWMIFFCFVDEDNEARSHN